MYVISESHRARRASRCNVSWHHHGPGDREYVDYVFLADVSAKDPRYSSRWMRIGEHRGLFRIDKDTQEVSLLRAMNGDEGDKRFMKAAGKVLSEWKRLGAPPKATQFASG